MRKWRATGLLVRFRAYNEPTLGIVMTVTVRNKVRIPIGGIDRAPYFVSFSGFDDRDSHFAILFGETVQSGSLVRMHSECMTGDVFLSERCDCGDQLREALKRTSIEGGCILYLRQEGRGIGLYAKFDAYNLQDIGLSTYRANAALGFGEDQRSYRCAADMLKALGLRSIRLITNNPDKVRGLESFGISVSERIGTGVFLKKDNRNYLVAKREHGHMFNLLNLDTSTPQRD